MNLAWKNILIENQKKQKLFCRHYFKSNESPNILYIQTPITSVSGLIEKAYEPLANYDFNIFAVDLSGIGKSEGVLREFTTKSIISDLDCCVNYIKQNLEGKLFFYAGTGIGGIIGQYYATYSNDIDAFAQYGVGIFQDLSPMRIPLWIAKVGYMMIKLFKKISPNLSIPLNPPKYSGKNKELDDNIYQMMLQDNPKIFHANINWMSTLMEIFIDKDSYLKRQPNCPTLVFQTLSDRYFPASYFEHYFDSLKCDKKIHVINDIHNSYYYRSDECCAQVANWFLAHTNTKDKVDYHA